jgi:pyrimidine-nucleoside phosphorylase
MLALDIIAKKRDGLALSKEEIEFFIQGLMQGETPDYQVAAWLMACYLQGMNTEETAHLTYAMAHSGRTLDVGDIAPLAVDKHSTGGVGDKTTLVVAPLVVAAGLSVAKISGRGLGFTGGTLDKLESFPGFTSDLDMSQFLDNFAKYRIVVVAQTPDLVPADGKLYALRDVTATVGSIPLIASSIMSKKLAVGARAIVLDVKVGKGAFMKSESKAIELARAMIDLGESLGRRVMALISDMNQPLGYTVGNALEVKEAIDTLQGAGPADFTTHCLTVGAQMLLLAEQAKNEQEAQLKLQDILKSGQAIANLKDLVGAQGGDTASIEDPVLLPQAKLVHLVISPQEGYISQLDAMEVGLTAVDLGAGRKKKNEPVDHAVGIVLHKKIGDRVERGEDLATIHAQNQQALERAQGRLLAAYDIQEEPVEPPTLIHHILR